MAMKTIIKKNVIDNIEVAGSFVLSKHKLSTEKGSGEAKLFVGSVSNKEEVLGFFNDFSQENVYFMNKVDIVKAFGNGFREYNECDKYRYSKDVDSEQDMMNNFDYIASLPEKVYFKIEEYADEKRIYIRSVKEKDYQKNWNSILRGIPFPKICKIRIVKKENNYQFFIDYLVNDLKCDVVDVSEINEEAAPYNGKTAENIIYYGAPGTGKSYGVSEYVNDHICEKQEEYDAGRDDCRYVFRATLHPEYTYSDFVGQVMPVVEKNGDEKSITYDFKPGVFTEALTYAEKHPDEAVFLVLEELSRANVAAVFGDVFQLLDRNDNGRSEYGIDNALIANAVYGDEKRKVFIPGNLFIIGTVNTSDQNVFAMDTAFKRRFNWKYVSINVPEEKQDEFNKDNNPEFMIDGIRTDWLEFYTELDKFITSELGMTEDKQIGPYFIKFRKTGDEYDEPREIIKDKLLQYLWDDVQGVARNMYAEKTLFLKEFTSYSMLYDAFDRGEKVFSDEFASCLGKSGKAAVDEAPGKND